MNGHDPSRPRVVALYLPLEPSCPGPANGAAAPPASPPDAPGLGAWQRLASSRALFPGHDQPRAPADLGYADARVPEVRLAQADLARAHGIDAFAYLHDWGAGRRRFARPFADVLASGEPDFPFCLCWDNEPRTPAAPSEEEARADDRAHAARLADAFSDRRYLRVGDRPVFVVLHPQELADPGSTLEAIRDAAVRRGTGQPLFLAAGGPPSAGFDAGLDWPDPDSRSRGLGTSERTRPLRTLATLVRRGRWLPHLVVESERSARLRRRERRPSEGRIPVVLAGWDDTPLRGSRGTVLSGRGPELFEHDLSAALAGARRAPATGHLVFLFAWNAWLEGAALEPDRRFGRGYLRAVARARLRAEREGR